MRALDVAGISLSLGINLVATLYIAFKAWYHTFTSLVFSCSLQVCRAHRRAMRVAYSHSAATRMPVNQMLTLMVECGLILCGVQVTSAYPMSVQSKMSSTQVVRVVFDLAVIPASASKPSTSPLNLAEAGLGPFLSLFTVCISFMITARKI